MTGDEATAVREEWSRPIGWWFLAGWTVTLTLGVLKLHQSTGDSDEYDLHTLGLGRLNRYQNYPRYSALPYVLRFCQAVDVAGNTLFSGMVALSSTSEHTPCNNA